VDASITTDHARRLLWAIVESQPPEWFTGEAYEEEGEETEPQDTGAVWAEMAGIRELATIGLDGALIRAGVMNALRSRTDTDLLLGLWGFIIGACELRADDTIAMHADDAWLFRDIFLDCLRQI
jgi:hypothetical protein